MYLFEVSCKNIKSTVDDNNIHSFVPLFEPPYDHAKNRLEKLGYKVSKCDTNEKTIN